jgi:outer membrane protein assembly factor BamB
MSALAKATTRMFQALMPGAEAGRPAAPGRWRGVLSALMAGALLAACGGKKVDEDLLPTPLIPLDDPLPVERLWSHKIGGSGENLELQLRPSTDGTAVFAAAHGGEVVAVDARSGKPMWETKTKLPLSAGPGYGEERLAVGSSDGDLAVLDAVDGTLRWQKNIGAEVLATPLVVAGLVIVRTVDGRLSAYDVDDSIERWSISREVPRLSLRGNAAPAASRDMVVAGFDDGTVAAVNLRTGNLLWDAAFLPAGGRTVIDRLGDVDADVRIIGDEVYVLGYQTQLASLSLNSGQIIWSLEMSGHQRPGLDWSRLYVTDVEGNVRAIDRSAGGNRWVQQDLRRRGTTGPETSVGFAIVADYEGYVHWLDYDSGLIRARVRAASSRIGVPPLVLDTLVYVQTDNGQLFAYRLRDE